MASKLTADNMQKLKKELSLVRESISPDFSRETCENKSSVQLLAYTRTVFSEIVRVRYWHHIHEGTLLRRSLSAQFLLYSIYVALDDVHKNPDENGTSSSSVDWNYVENAIVNDYKYVLQVLAFLYRISPSWVNDITQFRYFYGWINAQRKKRAVYTLNRYTLVYYIYIIIVIIINYY